jgi:hypothetical protein
MALEADNVQTRQVRTVAEHHAKRNDVLLDPRHAADKSVRADAHELMHGAQAAEYGVVTDADMTGQCGVVDQDDMIADTAIVGNVRADHEETVGADLCQHAAAFGARADRHILSDQRLGADL